MSTVRKTSPLQPIEGCLVSALQERECLAYNWQRRISVIGGGKVDMEISKAVKVLTKSIREDEELYYAYQSNIAVAFQDEFARSPLEYKNRQEIHRISNNAAKNFLNIWTAPPEEKNSNSEDFQEDIYIFPA